MDPSAEIPKIGRRPERQERRSSRQASSHLVNLNAEKYSEGFFLFLKCSKNALFEHHEGSKNPSEYFSP